MANEKRLIDANAFLENIEGIDWYTIRVDGSATQGAPSEEVAWYKATDIYAAIENAPTVDAVEVVRCKDCKLALEQPFMTGSTKLVCIKGINWRAVEPNHFCSYGERKD